MALVKYNNNSISAITTAGTLATGAMVLIKSQTASSSATISFVDGTSDVDLDATYPIYKFEFINIRGATDDKGLTWNASTDTGSNYNVISTNTMYTSYQQEDGSPSGLGYSTTHDHAQETGFKKLTVGGANDTERGASGHIWLFNPRSTTYVTHWLSYFTQAANDTYIQNEITAGYYNTTSAVDAIQFKMESGNIGAGTIKLYGLKDS